MSVFGSLYSGISGLTANSTAMAVIGNNIANINTPAFKVSRTEFSDILSSNMGVGRGTKVESVATLQSQGGFQATANVTDVALEGSGFFMLKDGSGLGTYFTRAGNFHIDEEGFLTNPSNYRVQGFDLDEAGSFSGTTRDIQINSSLLPPASTTETVFHLNLSSNETQVGPFDETNPADTSNFSSSITVYDSLGNAHQVTAYFTLTSQDPTLGSEWEWNVCVDGEDWNAGVPGTLYRGATGTITFDNQGRLDTETTTTSSFDFAGGAQLAQSISIDFGTSITGDGGSGLDGTTQFGEQNSTLFQNQDGYGPAYLAALDIDSEGRIYGKYGNGETRYFAQIAIANFTNPTGLDQTGGNMFGETPTSGDAIISVANVSGNGRIFGNSLEQSNVDLAQQFVNMIITQRGFQANSRSITTADEMMNELVNIVR